VRAVGSGWRGGSGAGTCGGEGALIATTMTRRDSPFMLIQQLWQMPLGDFEGRTILA
jgi:hypothetical protein